MTIPSPGELKAPVIDLDNRAYWEAASERRLTFGRCRSCKKAFFYPRHFCPFCLADGAELATASGKGKIYSFSVVRRTERPYAVAYVQLAEGPTMLTNIVDCDLEKLAIDQSVEVIFVPSQGGPLIPMFKPASS